SGPWKDWIGYGPSTRPPAGMTHLWNWPEGGPPPGSFAVHPDHLVGRVCMVGALAALLGGGGVHVECAQVETIINFLGDLLLRESIEPGSARPIGNRPRLVKCAGEERWVVIDGDAAITDAEAAGRVDRDLVAELQQQGI